MPASRERTGLISNSFSLAKHLQSPFKTRSGVKLIEMNVLPTEENASLIHALGDVWDWVTRSSGSMGHSQQCILKSSLKSPPDVDIILHDQIKSK